MDSNGRIVATLIERVLREDVPTENMAGQLVSTILDLFPEADDDPRFEQLMHVLASYEPAGGPYLFDAEALREECRRVLSVLQGAAEDLPTNGESGGPPTAPI
jgi:hypothetical protein